jgi:predicted O-methyltransferase YrrM
MTSLKMDVPIEHVLAEYETLQAKEDMELDQLTPEQISNRRDEFFVSIGRCTGLLVNLIIRGGRYQSVLELGTGLGYSTIWLAEAARATGGRVITVDNAANKQKRARAALDRARLLPLVKFQLGEALIFLSETSQNYDFVLLDLWKDSYIPCLDALLGRLLPGATIVADNMCEPAMVRFAAARYRAHLREIPELETILLTVGSGVAISRYKVSAGNV